MSRVFRCDAPGCGVEIADCWDYPRSVKIRGAKDWDYQMQTVSLGGGVYGYRDLIGGSSAWQLGQEPRFHACSDEHLLEILKAAPKGSTVIEFHRLSVKAAALAACIVVMAEDERIRSEATGRDAADTALGADPNGMESLLLPAPPYDTDASPNSETPA